MITTLIVEDSPVFRKALKELLAFYDPAMHIEEASEGVHALEIVQRLRPQVVFMDVNLPGESGLVLTGKIKELFPHTRVVILTAYDLPEYLEAAAAAGATCFAVKDHLSIHRFQALVRELKKRPFLPSSGNGSHRA